MYDDPVEDSNDDIDYIEQTGVNDHDTETTGVESHKPNDNTEPEHKP